MKRFKAKLSYLSVELDGKGELRFPPEFIKFGSSLEPESRPGESGTFGRHGYVVVYAVIGSSIEKEFAAKFAIYRAGSGGREIYRYTSEMINFLQEKEREIFSSDCSFSPNIKFGRGPIRIPIVELGESKPRSVVSTQGGGPIQTYIITEAHPPKNRYSRL